LSREEITQTSDPSM